MNSLYVFILLFYGTFAQTIVYKAENSTGVPKGDYMVQAITPPYNGHVTGLFWFEEINSLLWVERYNGTIFSWNYTDGNIQQLSIPEIDDEEFIGIFPLAECFDEYVLVSDNNFRKIKLYKEDGRLYYNLTKKPFLQIKDKGYIIDRAHTDSYGRLFVLTRYRTMKINYSQKVYRIEYGKKPVVVKESFNFGDFTFSTDETAFHIITDSFTLISQSDYDVRYGNVSSEVRVSSALGPYALIERFAAVDIDDHNNLWIAFDGKVVRFTTSLADRHRVKINAPCVSDVRFGGPNNDVLFVGTCNRNPYLSNTEGSIYSITGMGTNGVPGYPTNIATC